MKLNLKLIRLSFAVRVRYAPSPTGMLHIGGLRTAYYNYLFAKKQKGTFIVRVEDTDQARNVQGSMAHILDTLEWAGIEADQSPRNPGEFGPYIQSQRLELYRQIYKALLKNNLAYPCFCKFNNSGLKTQSKPYPGTCRLLSLQEIKTKIKSGEKYAVRLKNNIMDLPNHFMDGVYGEVVFSKFDDFVIVKQDGWPTFHLANVVDDWKMGITHVIRGQEWLTNTSKHLYLYKLLNAPIPQFLHLPLIQAADGKKLSKRDPQYSIQSIIKKDYDILALKNMLFRLGISSDSVANNINLGKAQEQSEKLIRNDQEQQKQSQNSKFKSKPKHKPQQKSLNRYKTSLYLPIEMIQKFNKNDISRSPAKYDAKMFEHINRLALRKRWSDCKTSETANEYFISRTRQYIPESVGHSKDFIQLFIGCVVQRINYISDIKKFKYFFIKPDFTNQQSKNDYAKIFGEPACEKIETKQKNIFFPIESSDSILKSKNIKIINNLRMIFQHLIRPDQYKEEQIAQKMSEFLMQSPEVTNDQLYHLLRFMMTGFKSGPNIIKTCELIGQKEVIQRIGVFQNAV